MKYSKALEIIKNGFSHGYLVSFEWKKGCILSSDHFPDKHAGEKPIETEREAWDLAKKFAAKTTGKCINIYVIRSDNFMPVPGYEAHEIENR